jgi:sucrose-phosphate synthase
MNNQKNKKLYIQLYSIHGLIRNKNPEFGRDADTGGQVKYVLELANALSKDKRVEKVELITRLIKDKNLSGDYALTTEYVNDKFSIVRIRAGGGKYLRKELLWNHLEEFVDKSIKHIKSRGRLPDIIHSHYADAGYVCSELTKFFGIPFIHTGHSLGRDKKRKLLNEGISEEDIEKRYKIAHRVKVEEEIIYFADMIVTSTSQEIQDQYGDYNNTAVEKFRVIPPGFNIEKFYPYNRFAEKVNEESEKWKGIIGEKLFRFFVDVNKPMILSICRPDKRKNISGLITAYGEDKQIQQKANLAIFAGIREDIQEMPDNEREVLTEILLLIDKYNLYGRMAIPKRHDTEHEIPQLYRIAAESGGIFVNAALVEPFGLTLIEAAASGVPVVATDDGGPRDIIKNCKHGILVDVSNPDNISEALDKILSDKALWNEFSQNGIQRVQRFYTWNAHKETYLTEIEKLLNKELVKKDTFAPIGMRLLEMQKLIVTDIDHTLLGDEFYLKEFAGLLSSTNKKTGFAVATGRTVNSAINVLKENNMLIPDVIISSVGSEIYYNFSEDLIYSKGWEAHISNQWNRKKISELLGKLDFLTIQEDETQRKFKLSYYVEDKPEYLKQVKKILIKNRIKANIIFSHKQFLDILPYRASKGKAIRYLAYRWNIPYEKILVAGDSGNDEEMLKGELLGVVVANYSKELEALKGGKRIFFAKRTYAGGIIDGINHYDFLNE